MASSFHYFFLLSIALCSLTPSLANKTKPNTFILPIKKDQATNLFYTTSVGVGTPRHNFNLVIDLSGENLWYDCDTNYNSSTYNPIPCRSKQCPDEAVCIGCNGPFKPGCTNNTCPGDTFNQYAHFLFSGGLGEDVIYLSQHKVPGFLSSCIDSDGFPSFTGNDSVFNGLPKTSKGIIGLARSQLSLPIQLASVKKLQPKFSLCLPSSNKQGFTNLLVGANGEQGQESKFLQTTPLIVNPVATGPIFVKGVASKEYFIDVKSVEIDGKVLNLKPSLLSIDNKGNGGTKISTMSPFTELQSTVYKTFIREYLKKASERKLKRVASVSPFEVCFDSTTIGTNSVPSIDLVLQGGVKWTIHEPNSMVMVKKNVACLAFVDGGTKPIMSFVKASIVIGGHQLQDNLLVFDHASSKLSFSSSLLLHNSSCSQS